jgi:hypothetical protein
MVPAPELASPPLTDQFTLAAPPLVSVAVNCSTAVPEVVALQPVQFVSILPAAEEMEKLEFEELAAVMPVLHPARTSTTGNADVASRRSACANCALRACGRGVDFSRSRVLPAGSGIAIRDFSSCSTLRCKRNPDSHASLTFTIGCRCCNGRRINRARSSLGVATSV